ncbi:hypothetical protein BCR39DRAFT_511240 [Naematelia encephala]|uniref:Uncharacterized protein n=1 Tax=Naematelia encephala TaxID=71784 RepID=A0A1Y2BLI8_9TREE|nr:hypothetical protein BCR39DRAFT_511240 [Naematelia encephala]
MSHLEDPSPTPTGISMAPPVNANKRPRPSATAAAGGGASTAATVQPRAKRRKPEDSVGPDDRRAGVAGKLKDEEGEGEIHTKIDFRELPVETLYKYLEMHDLLPRWEVSPWSEEPCIAPNALYANPPPAPPVTTTASPRETLASPPPTVKPSDFEVPPASTSETTHLIDGMAASGLVDGLAPIQNTIPQSNDDPAQPISTDATTIATEPETDIHTQPGRVAEQEPEPEPEPEPTVAPPTTRSKTAPSRRVPTPPPPPKRGVITLSDMYAARDVLAEKANAHWIKGLGGGQNKESETIVNFLYKMKVGPGRLLRVYNPNYPQ